MTKAELIEKVHATQPSLTKKAVGDLVDHIFDSLAKAIRKEKRFTYPGFGTFTIKQRKGRTGRNPQTGEAITIKPSRTVGFKPAPELKKQL